MKNPRTILEALGFWLNFELSCKRQELFNERHMAYPIGQYLFARYGHGVRTEYVHPILASQNKGSGGKPKIDFVVINNSINNRIELAIETKWVSKSNTLARDICRDLIRLSLLLDNNNCSSLLIISGKSDKIQQLFKKEELSFFPLADDDNIGNFNIFGLYKQKDKFIISVLKSFNDVEIQNSISIKKIVRFNHDLRGSQYPVYGWRIVKKSVNRFKI